jgi:membrane protease subunit HflC
MNATVIKLYMTLFVLIVVWTLASASTFTVQETEQVVVTQFGAPVGQPVTQAGLHFKTPFIQDVNRIDKRILEWDGDTSEAPTKDKLYIEVDTYARWRISDSLLFYKRFRSENVAQSRLDDILDGETRNAIANYDLVEIVRTSNRKPQITEEIADASSELGKLDPIQVGRVKISQEIQQAASKRLKDMGIELLDIRFKRINYNPTVQADIYRRMISERNQIADKYRAEGEGEAARIRGQMDRDLKQIRSEAYMKTQAIRGKADAEAADIYSKAYNQGPDAARFYAFQKTLETYEKTLGKDSTLILTTDSNLFSLLKNGPAGETAVAGAAANASAPKDWTPNLAMPSSSPAPATPAKP